MTDTGPQVAFIAGREQYVAYQHQVDRADIHIATADYELLAELENERRLHINLARFCGAEATFANYRRAWEMASQWPSFPLPCGDADAVRPEWTYALWYILNILTAVEGVCSGHGRPTRAYVFAETSSIQIGYDPFSFYPDLFNAVTRHVMQLRGVPVADLTLDKPDSHSRFGGGRRTCAWTLPEAGPVEFIAHVPSMGFHELRVYLDALRNRRQYGLIISDRELDVPFPMLDSRLLERLPVRGETWQVLSEWVRNGAATSVSDPSIASFLAGPWGRNVLQSLANSIGYVERCRQLGRLVSRAVKAPIALSSTDEGMGVKGFLRGLRENDIPAIVMAHVGLATEYKGVASVGIRHGSGTAHIATWSEADATMYRPWASGRKVRAVGILKADPGASRSARSSTSKRICLFTGKNNRSELCRQFIDYDKWRSFWSQIRDLTSGPGDFEWLLKTHPRSDYHLFYARELAGAGVRLWPQERPITAMDYDVGIIVDSPSTVAWEIIRGGNPLVYVKHAMPDEVWSPIEQGAVPVRTMDELMSVVNRLFSDDGYRDEVVARQQAWLKEAVVAWGDDAVANMDCFIAETVSERSSKPSAPSNPEVDPSARWIVDMLIMIQNLQRGARWVVQPARINASWIVEEEKKVGWRAYLHQLRRRGRDLSFDHLDGLDVAKLGDALLNGIVWQPWRPAREGTRNGVQVFYPVPIPLILWKVWRCLPPSIRPGPKTLIRYAREAVKQDAANHPQSRLRSLLTRIAAVPCMP